MEVCEIRWREHGKLYIYIYIEREREIERDRERESERQRGRFGEKGRKINRGRNTDIF